MVLFFRCIAHGVCRFVSFSLLTSLLRCPIAVVPSLSRFMLDVLVRLRHAVAIGRLRGLFRGLTRIRLPYEHPAITMEQLRRRGISVPAHRNSERPERNCHRRTDE